MTTERTKTLEIHTGTGKIYRGDWEIATVLYELVVGELPQEDVEGKVTVIQGEWDFRADDVLILHLAGGHWQFEFVPMSATGTSPALTYRVSPLVGGRGLFSVE